MNIFNIFRKVIPAKPIDPTKLLRLQRNALVLDAIISAREPIIIRIDGKLHLAKYVETSTDCEKVYVRELEFDTGLFKLDGSWFEEKFDKETGLRILDRPWYFNDDERAIDFELPTPETQEKFWNGLEVEINSARDPSNHAVLKVGHLGLSREDLIYNIRNLRSRTKAPIIVARKNEVTPIFVTYESIEAFSYKGKENLF